MSRNFDRIILGCMPQAAAIPPLNTLFEIEAPRHKVFLVIILLFVAERHKLSSGEQNIGRRFTCKTEHP